MTKNELNIFYLVRLSVMFQLLRTGNSYFCLGVILYCSIEIGQLYNICFWFFRNFRVTKVPLLNALVHFISLRDVAPMQQEVN